MATPSSLDKAEEIRAFRAALRARLIAAREALGAAEHATRSQEIERLVEPLVDCLALRSLGFCWPHRAEFDARGLVARAIARGLSVGLPVVASSAAPLDFRSWTPQSEMIEDRYGIHIPTRGDIVHPAAVLMPLVAFDADGYRLGYGGGYFDRTLAALDPRPLAIGVGFELARVDTIRPQAHDEPLDCIVTEAGISVVDNGRLHVVGSAQEAAARLSKRVRKR